MGLKYVTCLKRLALNSCLFLSKQQLKSKLRRFCISPQKLQHGKVGGTQTWLTLPETAPWSETGWNTTNISSNSSLNLSSPPAHWKVLNQTSPAAISSELPTSSTSQPVRAPALCHVMMPSFSTWKLFNTCYLFCIKLSEHQASCTCLRKWQSWDAQPTLTPTPIIPMCVHTRDWKQQNQCGEGEQLHFMVSKQGCYPWTQTREKLNLLTPKVLKTFWN